MNDVGTQKIALLGLMKIEVPLSTWTHILLREVPHSAPKYEKVLKYWIG